MNFLKLLIIITVITGLLWIAYPTAEPYLKDRLDTECIGSLKFVSESGISSTNNEGELYINEPAETKALEDYENKPENAFLKYIISPNSDLVINITSDDSEYRYPEVYLTNKWYDYARSEQKEIVSNMGEKIVSIVYTGLDRNPSSISFYVDDSNVARYTAGYVIQGDKVVTGYTVYIKD